MRWPTLSMRVRRLVTDLGASLSKRWLHVVHFARRLMKMTSTLSSRTIQPITLQSSNPIINSVFRLLPIPLASVSFGMDDLRLRTMALIALLDCARVLQAGP